MMIYRQSMRSRYVSENTALLCYPDTWFIFSHAGDGKGESNEETFGYVETIENKIK